MFNDKTRFWVIFDTSTRREYYEDVHDILALPAGATFRYQYRDKYLSSAARVAAEKTASAPLAILLAYGQWNQYVKGDRSKLSPPLTEMIWIPTRLAEMQLIPSIQGGNFFFDFKLLGYPNADPQPLLRIINSLAAAGEVPFQKWVSISDDLASLEALRQGQDSDNWQAIVDLLGTPPSQFAGDSFFRTEGPHRVEKNETETLILPTYVTQKLTSAAGVNVRSVSALYDVFDNENLSLQITSASPPPSAARDDVPVRTLTIQPQEDGPIAIEGVHSLNLRQYNSARLQFRTKRSEELDKRLGIITLTTGKSADQWPLGATVNQTYRIKKRPIIIIAAICTGVISGFLGLVAVMLKDKKPVLSICAGVIGLIFALITVLLSTGKIGFKL